MKEKKEAVIRLIAIVLTMLIVYGVKSYLAAHWFAVGTDEQESVYNMEAAETTQTEETTQTAETTQTEEAFQTTEMSETTVELRFRSRKLLEQHYEKHGVEMGFASAEEYEKAAAAVVSNPEALHKTEKEDGDDVYYLESTNEFVIVSTDGYLRTYFLPSGGIKYYNKQ